MGKSKTPAHSSTTPSSSHRSKSGSKSKPEPNVKNTIIKKKKTPKKVNSEKRNLLVGAMDAAFLEVQHAGIERRVERKELLAAKAGQTEQQQVEYQQQQQAMDDVTSILETL